MVALVMDPPAAVILHHELSKSGTAFYLAYLVHTILFINNFHNATQVAKRVEDNAMQVMGGMGYSHDMPVERLW
ncbi:hypothetical protein DQ04_00981010 [Trypanosoma grayi]|uniref:hypothetical protein n=1 Tax=Trypanosoma grayi TaxID=71804 RepID=UPI0004F4247E|nr:hypothetical protein DQ04_00981010 [Trypanosoma grayi]KEG13471.1 hypothetical protein DQ04_00981010 [Trypanosoma grayi]